MSDERTSEELREALLTTERLRAKAEQRRTLRTSAETLLGLLNQVLDYSKLEAGKLIIDAVDFDLLDETAETMALFQTEANRKGLVLNLEGDVPEETRVRGDPLRYRQILQNLLSNAVKFTTEGTIDLVFERFELEDSTGQHLVQIAVGDTGPGIPPDRMDRLFKPFSQADGSITRKYGGTGLGLSICKAICEAMLGEIGVESTVGEGSTFRFFLRFEVAKATPAPLRGRSTAPALGTLAAGSGGRRVLVVDDNAVNRMVLAESLSGAGFDIELSEDGPTGLERLATERFDLVLMDFHMPGMDGPTAVSTLRRSGGHMADVPVVALTADVMDDARVAFKDAQVQGFLTKPVDWRELSALIDRILEPSSRPQ